MHRAMANNVLLFMVFHDGDAFNILSSCILRFQAFSIELPFQILL